MAIVSAAVIAILVVCGWAVGWLGRRFTLRLREIRFAILAPTASTSTPSSEHRERLPQALRAFAERSFASLPVGAVAIRIRQKGEMRQSPEQPWSPFEAEQIIALDKIAFVWIAQMPMMPGLKVHVVDAYDGTRGFLAARLARAIPLATATGPEIDKGEVQRYLAELPWAPGALSANAQVSYQQVSDNAVVVAATLDHQRISVVLEIDKLGHVTSASTDARPRTVGTRTIATPWRGYFSDWRMLNGFELPAKAEVEWILKDGPFPCWRGEILAVEAIDRHARAVLRSKAVNGEWDEAARGGNQ
jgi:hypothetical protein